MKNQDKPTNQQQNQANNSVDENSKNRQLDPFRMDTDGQYLTTEQGLRISDTDNSLTAGDRGPTLMEDFHFREKMTHFDHESIPERIVHARGAGAHGYFQAYNDSFKKYTKAKFLTEPARRTPVFVRFSTVVGSRGSADTVRDTRGFSTKFYTVEGNYDLVANNMAPFFIQDAIKFPDLVHAIKPEPHHEMPQASAAHDNFWDFASLVPETTHMLMWVLSDRAIPRSFRMMEGFGVHTFRFINDEGKGRFVKLHWRPMLGVKSLVWDEAQKLAGKDPDWLRRDLWEAIEAGNFPEYELGVQVVEEEDEHAFAFDLLDATKIIPEELVPVQAIGKLVLNRNPDNFFAETEQVAFHPGNLVPGIDVTNDPLLQGRLFSYLDTQINRFSSANFTEVPINRPVAPVHNNQQNGFMRQTVNKGRTNYFPNSLGGGCPMMAPENMGGYVHYMEKVEGHKIRKRSESFDDHYSQATLFWNSMTDIEKKHIVSALHFELGKVETEAVRERMVRNLAHVDLDLAARTAEGIGVDVPTGSVADTIKNTVNAFTQKLSTKKSVTDSPALSQEKGKKKTVATLKVAILAANGVDEKQVNQLKDALKVKGVESEIVSKFLGKVKGKNGSELKVDKNHITTASIMYDAVLVPAGPDSVATLKKQGDALHFINETFKHCKTIGALGEGIELLQASDLKGVDLASPKSGQPTASKGVVTSGSADVTAFATAFLENLAEYRHWERDEKEMIPA